MEFEDFNYSNQENQSTHCTNTSDNGTQYPNLNCSDVMSIEEKKDQMSEELEESQNCSTSNQISQISKQKRVKKSSLLQKDFNFTSFFTPLIEDNQDNFILFGEIFCYFKSFLKYCRIGESIAPEYCYLTDFRPVVCTQIKNNMIYASLDCNDRSQQINEIKNKQIISSNFQKIDYICHKLKTISDNNAFQFTNHLQNYKNLIQQYANMVDQVHTAHNNDVDTIQDKLNQNFEGSVLKANQLLEKIQQENPNVILQFFIKKLDAFSLTSKTNMTGGNNNFIELISGTSKPNLISYYFTKFGTPEVLDWKGIVEITMAQFSGNQTFEFDLQTIDGYSIPAKAKYNFILLNSIEIIPGFSISDVLETYSYEINPQILKCIKTKRQLTVQKNIREDISYTIKSEIFLQKFYPSEKQNGKACQSNQNDNKSQNSNIDFSKLDSFSSVYDPYLQQQEIQSELFRINRQINSKFV